MNNQPILFVHSRDQNSAKIIETLKQLNKDNLCRMFYIDGKQRQELPGFLKSVPTLYVPESKDVYVGKDIYSYIAKPVTARREVPVSTPAQQAAQNPQAPKDYQAWSFAGAGSLTESFSSWESPSRFTTDDQLNYSFLGGGASAPVPPEPQTKQSFDGNKQGRNDDVNSRLEQYKKVRETEFKGIARQ
jgi:hypothetical protein